MCVVVFKVATSASTSACATSVSPFTSTAHSSSRVALGDCHGARRSRCCAISRPAQRVHGRTVHGSEDDGEEPVFEQWLTWLAAQRFDGWQADAADALFSAIRSRHLRGVEILCGGLQSEGIASALRSTPLLQLAATTRAEVAAVSRILLLADREHARRRRLLGWIATLRDLEPTAVEALLRDAQGTSTGQSTSTAQSTSASRAEQSAGASGSAVRQAAVSAVVSS